MSEIVIAAAGGGKTTDLAARAHSYAGGEVALVTYTINGAQEIRSKLYEQAGALPAHAEIWTWYRFLLHELARPYQRAILDRRIEGLAWVEGRSPLYLSRTKPLPFFLDQRRQVYSDKIARLIVECNEATGGAVIRRLAERYQAIFIDEIQDMAGYDLDLLELILKSKIDLVMVGDHRQATYSTNNAARNKGYAGAKIILKFQEWEKAGLAPISYSRETHRCHQAVANLADSLFPYDPTTISKNAVVTDHDGVFTIAPHHVADYVARYAPQVLRLDRRTPCGEHDAMNFGEAKGMTFDRVLIFPHQLGKKWLATGEAKHVQNSVAKLYVGISRARHSVAFVHDGDSKIPGLKRYG